MLRFPQLLKQSLSFPPVLWKHLEGKIHLRQIKLPFQLWNTSQKLSFQRETHGIEVLIIRVLRVLCGEYGACNRFYWLCENLSSHSVLHQPGGGLPPPLQGLKTR